MTLLVVLASDPDTVEVRPFEMTLKDTRYNALVVEGDIAAEDVLNEPFPGESFTPNPFRGAVLKPTQTHHRAKRRIEPR